MTAKSTFDADRRGTEYPPRVVRAKSAEERKGARAMKSIKERLKVHAEIERQNRAKLDAFKRQQKKGGSAA